MRPLLLTCSILVAVFLIGGGLAVKVGAGENSYRQVVLFSEILSLVIDNYVDPVESDALLEDAYEGLLGALDANGAYLTAAEVAEWKSDPGGALAQPGLTVLKAGRSIQVVAVDPGSPAERAEITVGDQIRAIDGRSVRELSLQQCRRLLRGAPGTTVRLDLLHPLEAMTRETVEVERELLSTEAYEIELAEPTVAVLRIRRLGQVSVGKLAERLEQLRAQGLERLLLDLRNAADLNPADVAGVGGLFTTGVLLRLRDGSGSVVEEVAGDRAAPVWGGDLAVLVNGATAGSAEALAGLIQSELGGTVLGESTYGYGAEAELFELETGAGLVVSSAVWETVSGKHWNRDGIEPDELIRGRGQDYEEVSADQLRRALEWLAQPVDDAAAKVAA
jgi:carboxyl-terminal processing protease